MPKASEPGVEAEPSRVAALRAAERAGRSASVGDCRIEERSAPVPGASSRLRVYRPAIGDAARPGLVFFHGGGFVVGEPASHEALCAALAREADCVVVSCGYRLAPEQRFPVAVDDAYFTSCFVHEHADELGIDHRRLGIAGIEVGAGLAVTVARLAKERRNPALAFQWLIAPALDLRLATSVAAPARAELSAAVAHYVRTPEDRLDPRCSPLLAKNLIGLPRVLITCGQADGLRDDAGAFARLLEQVGVPVQLDEQPGAALSFMADPAATPAGRAALRACVLALASALRSP